MRTQSGKKPSVDENRSAEAAEMPIEGRRILLVARIIGTVVAAIYLMSVFGEVLEGRFHIDKTIGQGRHGNWATDSTVWLHGPLGITTWALFKLPPLIALWLICLKPSLLVKGRLKYVLLVLFSIGASLYSLLDSLEN